MPCLPRRPPSCALPHHKPTVVAVDIAHTGNAPASVSKVLYQRRFHSAVGKERINVGVILFNPLTAPPCKGVIVWTELYHVSPFIAQKEDADHFPVILIVLKRSKTDGNHSENQKYI